MERHLPPRVSAYCAEVERWPQWRISALEHEDHENHAPGSEAITATEMPSEKVGGQLDDLSRVSRRAERQGITLRKMRVASLRSGRSV